MAVLLLAGSGSAAVLEYIGQSTGTTEVSASVTMDGNTQYNGDSAFSVSQSTGGGAVASDVYRLENTANEVIPIGINKSTVITDGSTEQNSDPEGVNSTVVTYSRSTDQGSSDTFGVDVSVITDQSKVEGGNYDLRVSSGGTATSDYATVWYEPTVETVDGNTDLTVQSSVGPNNDASSDDTVDEVYLLDQEGNLYFSTDSDLGTVYPESDPNTKTTASDFTVEAVGFGYGNADRTSDVNVNVTIEEVSLGGEVLSENGQGFDYIPFNPTGDATVNADGASIDIHNEMSFQTVSDFSNDFYTESGNQVEVTSTVDFR